MSRSLVARTYPCTPTAIPPMTTNLTWASRNASSSSSARNIARHAVLQFAHELAQAKCLLKPNPRVSSRDLAEPGSCGPLPRGSARPVSRSRTCGSSPYDSRESLRPLLRIRGARRTRAAIRCGPARAAPATRARDTAAGRAGQCHRRRGSRGTGRSRRADRRGRRATAAGRTCKAELRPVTEPTARRGATTQEQLEPRHRTYLSLRSKRDRSPHYVLRNSP